MSTPAKPKSVLETTTPDPVVKFYSKPNPMIPLNFGDAAVHFTMVQRIGTTTLGVAMVSDPKIQEALKGISSVEEITKEEFERLSKKKASEVHSFDLNLDLQPERARPAAQPDPTEAAADTAEKIPAPPQKVDLTLGDVK